MRKKYIVFVDYPDGKEMPSLKIEELLYASLVAQLGDENVDVSAWKLRDFLTWQDVTERD